MVMRKLSSSLMLNGTVARFAIRLAISLFTDWCAPDLIVVGQEVLKDRDVRRSGVGLLPQRQAWPLF